jgi:hypothetical protein
VVVIIAVIFAVKLYVAPPLFYGKKKKEGINNLLFMWGLDV